MNLGLLRRKWGIPSKVVEFLWTRKENHHPNQSKRITYGGDSGSSDCWGLLSDWFDKSEAAYFMILDTGSGILLMVSQTSESSC